MAEFVSGNIFIREMRFEKSGDAINGHAHNFDHTTYVIRGSVKMQRLDAAGNVEREVVKKASDGHNWVLIKAGVFHRIIAVEDNSMAHCIYSHRSPQGEVVQQWEGWDYATQ